MSISDLPALNASLNAASAVLLSAGYLCIRRRRVVAHRSCMLLALLTSALFLPFRGTGWTRPVYFALLISHTVLAATVVPLALVTVTRAARRRFDRHVAIARYTLPIWMYVSVTGVVIYVVLYRTAWLRP